MAIVPAPGATAPSWQVQDWHRGHLRWIGSTDWFNGKTEELYAQFKTMPHESDDYVHFFTQNKRAGVIPYVLNFKKMTQTNRMTGEVLRIRRVALWVLDCNPE